VSEDHTGGPTGRPRQTERRVTVSEAALALGITPEAVRMRIKRDTLRSERRAGRVYVVLGLEPNTEHTTDRTDLLIATLREQLERANDSLTFERQAHAEARRLLAAALERIPPQLEPPRGGDSSPQVPSQEPSEASVRAAEGVGEGPSPAEPQEASESPETSLGYESPGPTRTPTEASGDGEEAAQRAQEPSSRRWWEFWR
jgi:hypothetical protein